MAWNPSPEVKIARDAAESLRRATKSDRIDMCVVTWIDDRQRAGYASYGRTPALCGLARRLADAMYETITDDRKFDVVLSGVLRGNERAADGSSIDFDGLEREVVGKLRLLRAAVGAEMDADARRLIVRDLVLPAAELLARFCACVNVEGEVPE